MAVKGIREVRLDALSAPPPVKAALFEFIENLSSHAEHNLSGLVLFGGLAGGRYDPDRSDINVVVVLKDASITCIKDISEVLRQGWKRARIEPMIMTEEEVRKSADTFPTKFLHIQDNHILLFGIDPFVDLKVPREFIRLRIEQEMRNTSLRLRRRFITFQNDPYKLAAILASLRSPLEVELRALLALYDNDTVPPHYEDVIKDASKTFDLDQDALLTISNYSDSSKIDIGNVPQIYSRVLASVTKAADIADAMD